MRRKKNRAFPRWIAIAMTAPYFLLQPSLSRAARVDTATEDEKEGWQIPENACDQFLKVSLDGGPIFLIGNNPEQKSDDDFSVESGELLCVGFVKSTGTYKRLLQEGGRGGNQFDVEIKPDRKITVTESLPDVRAYASFPFSETTITCDATGCGVSESHCVLALPPNPYPGIVQELENLDRIDLQKVRAGTNADDVNNFLNPLLIRALWGDSDAEKMLVNVPPGLDPIPTEVWTAAISDFERVTQLGCRPLRNRAAQ